jgi:hypothetical protein
LPVAVALIPGEDVADQSGQPVSGNAARTRRRRGFRRGTEFGTFHKFFGAHNA